MAGHAVPFHLRENREGAMSRLAWPAQLVFGKFGEWTGLKSASKSPASPSHPKVLAPKVLKQSIIRVATSGILTVSFDCFLNQLSCN